MTSIFGIEKSIENKTFFGIINNISEHVVLVIMVYTVGNVNHAMSIYGIRIFYSKYDQAPLLARYSLDIICSFSDVDDMFSMLETEFYAFRYV